jgi:hypothetical protein
MRMAMRFDAGPEKYRWLNESLVIAEGRLARPRRSSTASTACSDAASFE